MCSAIKVPELQGVESCLLHLLIRSTGGCPPEIGGCSTAILPSPLLLGATEVSTQQQCAEAQNSEFLPPLHIPTCVQRADLSMLRPTTGTVLVEMLCRPIVVSELADIPLQPPTVVSTCPAHVFHPVASSVLPARIVIPLASPTLDDIRPLSTLQSLCRRPTSRTAIQDPQSFRLFPDHVAAAGQSRTLPGWAFTRNTHPDKSCAFARHPSLGPKNLALSSRAAGTKPSPLNHSKNCTRSEPCLTPNLP